MARQQWINKKSISRAEAADPPKAKLNQQRRNSDTSGFDPYAILGLAKTATARGNARGLCGAGQEIPPRPLCLFDLPQEMKDYAAAMQARINMAYQQLGS